jgi:hypothetical protein
MFPFSSSSIVSIQMSVIQLSRPYLLYTQPAAELFAGQLDEAGLGLSTPETPSSSASLAPPGRAPELA